MPCSRIREQAIFYEHNRVSNAGLERALELKLKELLSSVSWLDVSRIEPVEATRPDPGYDIKAVLPLVSGNTTLVVECKRELRPSLFKAFVEQKRSRLKQLKSVVPVLAMPFCLTTHRRTLCAARMGMV
jgi:hypothetical protein